MSNSAKQWFNRGYRLDCEIQALQTSKQEMENRITSITPAYSGDVVCGTKDPHKFDEYAHFSAELAKRTKELVSIQREITDVVSKLDNSLHRTILVSRYVNFKDWEDIAKLCGLKKRRIYQLANIAIENAEKVLKESGKI